MLSKPKTLGADAHVHVNPVKGLGGEKVAKLMINSSMWFAAIVSLPHWDYDIEINSMDDYKRLFNLHIKECQKAREQGLVVSCFAGLHPAEIDRLIDKGFSHAKIYELSTSIIDFLFSACDERIIQGIGEVGRQHYNTRPDKVLMTNSLLVYTLEKAKDHDCILQLHLENIKGFTSWNLKKVVDQIGINHQQLIFHHLKPGIIEEVQREGFFTTTPAYVESLEIAFKRSNLDLLLIESDFTDNTSFMRKVVEPWSLLNIEEELIKKGIISYEELYKINVDNIEKAFKVNYKVTK